MSVKAKNMCVFVPNPSQINQPRENAPRRVAGSKGMDRHARAGPGWSHSMLSLIIPLGVVRNLH